MTEAQKITILKFILILTTITIIVLGVFLYKFNFEKKLVMKKSSELQSKIDDLNIELYAYSQIPNEIQNPVANNTSEPINSETLINDFIKNYFEIAWKIFETSYDIFKYNPYSDTIDLPVERTNYTWLYYKITNYDEVINRYISSSFINFEDNFRIVILENGNHYIIDSAEGSPFNKLEVLKITNQSENSISCIIKAYIVSTAGDQIFEKTYDFEIIKENNDWKINKFMLLSEESHDNN